MAHSIKIKVYYEDTDAGGVVYYANYLRFMERARTEFLIDKGIDIVEYHKQGLFFVVAHVDIHYQSSARLGDTVDVTTEIVEQKNATMILKNTVLRGEKVLAEALVTIACIEQSGRPRRFPDAFRSLS